ncbi:MAG TPA: hypothetical protein VK843_12475 [Planctomycetota bacterium]|nr:hypothetical protein [Planctomycetota bacterium]
MATQFLMLSRNASTLVRLLNSVFNGTAAFCASLSSGLSDHGRFAACSAMFSSAQFAWPTLVLGR